MRRVLAVLLLVAPAVAARELNDLPGVIYAETVPSYAEYVDPAAPIPPPLSPDLFQDPDIRARYRESFLLRQVLLQLPCYCGCHGKAEHKSLYACYVAPVGAECYSAECVVCLEEAKMAEEMVAKGAAVEDIRAAIDARYGGGHAGHGH
jgi:hypothetical protein